MIKDSGERTKFGTGAVRDMHAGKGRMDLLPLSALIELSKHCEEGGSKMIKDSGERTKFGTGAVRDMHAGKGRMDLLPLSALIELSKHCEEGDLKYGEHNVDKNDQRQWGAHKIWDRSCPGHACGQGEDGSPPSVGADRVVKAL